MHIVFLILVAFGLVMPASLSAGEDAERDAFVQESRVMVKAFAGSLKGALQAAIKKGGPRNAIPVCNVKAPESGTTGHREATDV